MSLRGAVRPRGPVAPLAATALLLALAFPPFHLVAPSFVALVPMGAWLARLPAGRAGLREAVRGGFAAGALFFGLLLYWVATALLPTTVLALPAYAGVVALLAALFACAAGGMHLAVHRSRWPVWLALPVFWTAMEWVRAHMGDLSFPWMQLGDSLSGWPRLIGAADLVGSRGLSFWLALVGGLLAEALLRARPPALERWLPAGRAGPAAEVEGLRAGGAVRDTDEPLRAGKRRGATAEPGAGPPRSGERRRSAAWRPLAAALLAAAVPVAYSLHRWSSLESRPAARVAVLQPDVDGKRDLRPEAAADSARAAVDRLLRRGPVHGTGDARGELDAVVLPETTLPVVMDRVPGSALRGRPELERWVTGLAARLGAPVLYGAFGAERQPGGGGTARFNSAFLRSPEGRRLGRYAKRRLVPGVETVPFVDAAWLRSALPGLGGPRFGGLTPGPRPRLLPAGRARFGVLICFESAFAELSRAYRARGADFLVNVTNDAWFGREHPRWARTSGLWQHPAHLVMRAVETRAGIVRAAATGISGVVDPRGRFTHRTDLFEPAVFAADVATTASPPPYVRWGDLAGPLSAAAAAVAVLLGLARARAARRNGLCGLWGAPDPKPVTLTHQPREDR